MRVLRLLALAGTFAVDLVRSHLKVAREVATPGLQIRPGVVAVPVELRGARLATVANMITLTPGTISIDVAPDESVLYVHALHLDSPEALRDEVHALERRVRAATGPGRVTCS